ncbi:hypothetical protein Ancab_006981 [Ancistrocladus abbreviatus]
MLQNCLGNIRWGKLHSPFSSAKGKSREDGNDGWCTKLNVNEEYKEVFRTNSFTEICTKVQGQLRRKSIDRLSSSSPLPSCVHLSDCLLEPRQETVKDLINTSTIHSLLVDYFDASLEAYNICELILRSIHKTRSNHRFIKRTIKVANGVCSREEFTKDQCQAMVQNLTSFALLSNPLSNISSNQLNGLHDRFALLLRQLTSRRRKIKRKVTLTRFSKRAAGCTLVISCTALAVTLLVLLAHSIVGLVGAPGVAMTCFWGMESKKRVRSARYKLKVSLLERLGTQLDVAAKGVYILSNDFDTMGRLAMRLNDEVEHRKVLGDMCVRNVKCQEVLKEAVRELNMHETRFLEQLEELEEHVYLCFLTINRSRRLVIQEIVSA